MWFKAFRACFDGGESQRHQMTKGVNQSIDRHGQTSVRDQPSTIDISYFATFTPTGGIAMVEARPVLEQGSERLDALSGPHALFLFWPLGPPASSTASRVGSVVHQNVKGQTHTTTQRLISPTISAVSSPERTRLNARVERMQVYREVIPFSDPLL